MKAVVEDIYKEMKGVAELEIRLGLVQQKVSDLSDGHDEMFKLEKKDLETTKQEMKKGGGQSSTLETVKEVISIMQADPLSPIYEKAIAEMGKVGDRLEDMLMELKVIVNQPEPKIVKILTEKVRLDEDQFDGGAGEADRDASLSKICQMEKAH